MIFGVDAAGTGALTWKRRSHRGEAFEPVVLALPLAEELEDQHAVRVESLDAERGAALRRFLHQPDLGDVVEPQMQVEARVEHVLPWPICFSVSNVPEWIWMQPRLPTKSMTFSASAAQAISASLSAAGASDTANGSPAIR